MSHDPGLPARFEVRCCAGCGCVFQDAGASLLDYERYYRSDAKYHSSPTIGEETAELFRHYLGILGELVRQDARILDLGCAGGAFLEKLRAAGYERLVGVDPSRACVDEIRARGIEAHEGGVYTPGLHERVGRSALVILSGVIEHLYDPATAMRGVEQLLRDGGHVFVTAPDAARYGEHDHALAYYFNHEHINHFTPASLDNLMGQCGYRRVATHRHDVRFGDATVPVFSSSFQKGARGELLRDDTGAESIRRYLEQLRRRRAEVVRVIEELLAGDEELVIWGAGAVASELLAATSLGRCRILMFIDSDRAKQGTTFHDRPIRAPEALRGFTGPVVVCAALYATAISKEVERLAPGGRIVVLR